MREERRQRGSCAPRSRENTQVSKGPVLALRRTHPLGILAAHGIHLWAWVVPLAVVRGTHVCI